MKQNELFINTETGTQQGITLYKPSESALKAIKRTIGVYTMPVMKEWCHSFGRFLSTNTYEILNSRGKTIKDEDAWGVYMQGRNLKKEVLINFLAFFLGDTRNFTAYLQGLSGAERSVWKGLVVNGYMDDRTYMAITHKKMVRHVTGWYAYNEEKATDIPLFSLFKTRDSALDEFGYRDTVHAICIDTLFYEPARKSFFPEGIFAAKFLDKLPSDEFLHTITTTEKELTEQLPVLKSLAVREILTLNANARLLTTVKKKVSQQAVLTEYFPTMTDNEYKLLRYTLTLYPIALFYRKRGNVRLHCFEKECLCMFKEAVDNIDLLVTTLMPHISGLHSEVINYYSSFSDIVNEVCTFLKSGKGWFCVDDMLKEMYYKEHSLFFYTVFDATAFYKQNLKNKKTGKYVRIGELHSAIFTPFVKAFLLMMNGLGMLDVAYRDASQDDTSYVDALRYVRLTNLGAYVMGITQTYTPIKAEKKIYFRLDDRLLILKSMEKDNPYEGMVADLAEHIGGGRYLVSSDSFLKNCKTEKDVKDKIGLFKEFVADKFTDVWSDFFKSVLAKCNPLEHISNDTFVIYRIAVDNTGLLQLLVSDETLKKNIIRAEGYLILIKKDKLKKVIDRLKTFGYLL